MSLHSSICASVYVYLCTCVGGSRDWWKWWRGRDGQLGPFHCDTRRTAQGQKSITYLHTHTWVFTHELAQTLERACSLARKQAFTYVWRAEFADLVLQVGVYVRVFCRA